MENAIMVAAALIGAGITAGLAAVGAGLGDGLVTSRFIEGITRPSASSRQWPSSPSSLRSSCCMPTRSSNNCIWCFEGRHRN